MYIYVCVCVRVCVYVYKYKYYIHIYIYGSIPNKQPPTTNNLQIKPKWKKDAVRNFLKISEHIHKTNNNALEHIHITTGYNLKYTHTTQ